MRAPGNRRPATSTDGHTVRLLPDARYDVGHDVGVENRAKRQESAWASIVEFSPNISLRTLSALFATLAIFWLFGASIGWTVGEVSTGAVAGFVVGFVAWVVLIVVALCRSNIRGWRYRGQRRPD